ncbi:hypothetical protein CFOL_v3_13968 [Cephalotus follicularis]|uniref:Uncharacterized protein n=1 Tax=Cephalotus follicularis TaxID=3775 RepID=A0A1Q3BR33_CEPFO|nr:hypothetical protein CFOL_v3_13968 [Cephalotus follicularis]
MAPQSTKKKKKTNDPSHCTSPLSSLHLHCSPRTATINNPQIFKQTPNNIHVKSKQKTTKPNPQHSQPKPVIQTPSSPQPNRTHKQPFKSPINTQHCTQLNPQTHGRPKFTENFNPLNA